jgi:hypothetical protein
MPMVPSVNGLDVLEDRARGPAAALPGSSAPGARGQRAVVALAPFQARGCRPSPVTAVLYGLAFITGVSREPAPQLGQDGGPA